MQADAKAVGLNIPLISGYRSYETQEKLHKKYVLKDGEKNASTYSAVAGNSEHQTGLAFDIGSVDRSFEGTDEAKWISENAHLYGFIVFFLMRFKIKEGWLNYERYIKKRFICFRY